LEIKDNWIFNKIVNITILIKWIILLKLT
jgi:hypothetical protein